MSVVLPRIRVGEPVGYQTLTVFPLFDGAFEPVEYTLSDEGIDSGSVTVEEVSAAGFGAGSAGREQGRRAGAVLGRRGADRRQAEPDPEHVGADRRSRQTKIPVSCVEQGRWSYRSRRFGHGGRHSSSKLRRVLKKSVHDSIQAKRGHRSDQGSLA
jgi:hypothetical protein